MLLSNAVGRESYRPSISTWLSASVLLSNAVGRESYRPSSAIKARDRGGTPQVVS